MLKVEKEGSGKVTLVKEPNRIYRHNTGKVIIGNAWVPKPRPMTTDSDVVTQGLLMGHFKPRRYTGFIGRRLQAMGLL